jgi:hypothetical protein
MRAAPALTPAPRPPSHALPRAPAPSRAPASPHSAELALLYQYHAAATVLAPSSRTHRTKPPRKSSPAPACLAPRARPWPCSFLALLPHAPQPTCRPCSTRQRHPSPGPRATQPPTHPARNPLRPSIAHAPRALARPQQAPPPRLLRQRQPALRRAQTSSSTRCSSSASSPSSPPTPPQPAPSTAHPAPLPPTPLLFPPSSQPPLHLAASLLGQICSTRPRLAPATAPSLARSTRSPGPQQPPLQHRSRPAPDRIRS